MLITCFLLNNQRSNHNHATKAFDFRKLPFLEYHQSDREYAYPGHQTAPASILDLKVSSHFQPKIW